MNQSDVGVKSRSVILLIGYFSLISITNWIIPRFYELPWPSWVIIWLHFFSFFIVSLLIWEERFHLEYSHIDKWSLLVILIFGSILRPVASQSLLFAFIYISIAVLLFLGLRKNRVQFSISRRIGLWAFVGLLWGFGALVIATSIGVPIGDNLKAASTNYPRYLYTFLYEMTNTAIAEESIFRGFLWGTLRKTGWAERKILLIQAILFAIIHLNSYDVHSIAYYFAKFIFALFAGWLAWKSRSLVPSIISHSFHNTISFFLKSV